MTRLVRRWGVWAVVVVAVAGALLVGSHRTSHPTLDQRTLSLASEVRCPVCGGESAAQSAVPAAADIRDRIHQELAAGIPSGRVLDDITKSYGTWILERPPARGVGLLVWLLPMVAVAAAAGGLVLAFARWRRAGPAGAPGGGRRLGPGDEELVARALAGAGPPGSGPALGAGSGSGSGSGPALGSGSGSGSGSGEGEGER